MIVKNESKLILRCLESVRPIVDYVLVEDTGSTDGTQEIIREWLTRVGLPGEVYEEPWQDFAYNRSHALSRLRQVDWVDYALHPRRRRPYRFGARFRRRCVQEKPVPRRV